MSLFSYLLWKGSILIMKVRKTNVFCGRKVMCFNSHPFHFFPHFESFVNWVNEILYFFLNWIFFSSIDSTIIFMGNFFFPREKKFDLIDIQTKSLLLIRAGFLGEKISHRDPNHNPAKCVSNILGITFF